MSNTRQICPKTVRPTQTCSLFRPKIRVYMGKMSTNPPNLRPDLAPKPRFDERPREGQPTIGMVSLGCPKALVDSERILTRLRAEGYAISPDYSGADAVIVNTCGFLDSAKAESLEAIGEALSENGRVIVTGCLGAEPEYITGAHPNVLAVTGPPFLFGEDQARYLIACTFDQAEALMSAAAQVGVTIVTVGKFGGETVKLGDAEATLAEMSAIYRDAFGGYFA